MKNRLLSATLLLIFSVVQANALSLGRDSSVYIDTFDNSEKNKNTYFLTYDYFSVGNSMDNYKDNIRSYQSYGFNTSDSTNHPWGIAIGNANQFKAFRDLDLGWNFGYIEGPQLGYSLAAEPSSIYYSLKLDGRIRTSFTRLMVTMSKKFSITKKVELRASGGLGCAYASISEHGTWTFGSGTPVAYVDSDKSWVDWTGDIGIGLLFSFRKIGLEAGVKQSRFPSFKNADDFSDFKWNPSSVYLTLFF